MRAADIPDKFKELLVSARVIILIKKVPNKVHNVFCTGNVGSKETVDWLKGLSDNFVMVRGDYDEVRSAYIFETLESFTTRE